MFRITPSPPGTLCWTVTTGGFVQLQNIMLDRGANFVVGARPDPKELRILLEDCGTQLGLKSILSYSETKDMARYLKQVGFSKCGTLPKMGENGGNVDVFSYLPGQSHRRGLLQPLVWVVEKLATWCGVTGRPTPTRVHGVERQDPPREHMALHDRFQNGNGHVDHPQPQGEAQNGGSGGVAQGSEASRDGSRVHEHHHGPST